MNHVQHHIQRVAIPIVFPAGVRMGEGKELGNLLTQARDGSGQFVLRGTALAGAIRHTFEAVSTEDGWDVDKWFGSRRAESDLRPSRVRFSDARLRVGSSTSRGICIRKHNAIDRHRKAPIDGGLFSLESLPPETCTTLIVSVEAPAEDSDEATQLLRRIVGLFQRGLTLGGSTARGIGRAVLSGKASWKRWDLSNVEQHADWLDENYHRRMGKEELKGTPLEPLVVNAHQLVITLELTVPRGQDVLVADGQGVDFDMEPQEIRTADGRKAWLLPGSSLRGLFRAYVNRLAARDQQPVADSYQRWQERNPNATSRQPLTGEDIAFAFVPPPERKAFYEDPESLDCPVMKLFGTSYARGRIHIPDSICPADGPEDAQARTHVAIDRVSGGANEGFLFDNQVLTRAHFTVTIVIQMPSRDEARWIAQCIRALDMGLLRVGSSKAAGRLALACSPQAEGPHQDTINAIQPLEAYHV